MVTLLLLIKVFFLPGNIPKPLASFGIPVIELKASDGNRKERWEDKAAALMSQNLYGCQGKSRNMSVTPGYK